MVCPCRFQPTARNETHFYLRPAPLPARTLCLCQQIFQIHLVKSYIQVQSVVQPRQVDHLAKFLKALLHSTTTDEDLKSKVSTEDAQANNVISVTVRSATFFAYTGDAVKKNHLELSFPKLSVTTKSFFQL